MRYRLELAAEDEDYSVLDRGRFGDEGHRIIEIESNKIVGYLWYQVHDDRVIYVDMIEIIEKGEGTGTRVVNDLFEILDARALTGEVLDDGHMMAYYFWESFGSEMEVGEDEEGNPYDPDELMHSGYTIPFWLER